MEKKARLWYSLINMRRYLEHMHTREPHERRKHALHVATAITGLLFVGWVATLGVRLGGDPVVAQNESNNGQAAAAVQAVERSGPRLEVSSTSVSLPQYNNWQQ